MKTNKNFKGFDYYKLQQDDDGNIKLNDYDDVLNARRAKVDILLDSVSPDNDSYFAKLNKALSEKFIDDNGLWTTFDKEDHEIAQEESKSLFTIFLAIKQQRLEQPFASLY